MITIPIQDCSSSHWLRLVLFLILRLQFWKERLKKNPYYLIRCNRIAKSTWRKSLFHCLCIILGPLALKIVAFCRFGTLMNCQGRRWMKLSTCVLEKIMFHHPTTYRKGIHLIFCIDFPIFFSCFYLNVPIDPPPPPKKKKPQKKHMFTVIRLISWSFTVIWCTNWIFSSPTRVYSYFGYFLVICCYFEYLLGIIYIVWSLCMGCNYCIKLLNLIKSTSLQPHFPLFLVSSSCHYSRSLL